MSVSVFGASGRALAAPGGLAAGEPTGCEALRPHPDALANVNSAIAAMVGESGLCDVGLHSTIVSWESSTTNGLNSPVRPYLSLAVTVYRMMPIGAVSGTTHLATQN